MQTEFCKQLGIDVPIFAFTHCRDVVAEVSNAGGMGVLGAAGFTPEQLRQERDREAEIAQLTRSPELRESTLSGLEDWAAAIREYLGER